MIPQFHQKFLKSTSGLTLTLLAGAVIIGGCETTSTPDMALVSAEQAEAKAIGEMVLPVRTDDASAKALYMEGWADFENSRNVTAYEKFAAAAEADPSFTMAHVLAAWVAPSTEAFVANAEKASASAEGAPGGERMLVGMLEGFLSNDAQGAADKAWKAAELHSDSPRMWIFAGATRANLNETEMARKAFKKATKLDPSFVPGFINLGNNYLGQEPKDFAMAEKYISKAVALTPDEPNPHDLLGDVHRAQGNLEAAYKDYTKAAELAPDLGSGLQQRGHVNSFLGNYEEARSDYSRAADLEDARGSAAGPNFRVFGAYVNLHEGNPDAAMDELQAISDALIGSSKDGVTDTRSNALYNIAYIATEVGNSERALKAIKEASAIQMARAETLGSDNIMSAAKATKLYNKGMLAARMGDSEKAATIAAAFEEQVADNTSPRKLERMHEIQGMAAYYQGDFANAAKHLSKGNHQFNMATKYYLARAHEQAGNASEAARLFDEMSVYNFNGPGYAMFRKDILARAAAG